MSDAIEVAKQKDAIINARGESKMVAASAGTRKYLIHLSDGRVFTCIDLVKDDPDEVEKQLRDKFSSYGVVRIER